MIQIRPVSDLRNKFPEIESIVNEGGAVYLTKNGHGAMVVMSLAQYASLTGGDETPTPETPTHDVVIQGVKTMTKKVRRGK